MLSRLVTSLFGPFSFKLKAPLNGVAVDSRLIQPGGLFFALRGERVDGHRFLQEVSQKGAYGAVIRRDFTGEVPAALPVVRVEDPLQALQCLAKARIREVGARVAAITGSVGKTTTKEFARTLFSAAYPITATRGNNNSQIGMSLSLLNDIRGDEKWLVVEMGMSGAGEIRRLTEIVPPDIALIASVAPVHAEFFESVERIAHAKAEIFEHSNTQWGLYNADTLHAETLKATGSCQKRAFSLQGDPQAFWALQVYEGSVRIREGQEWFEFPCPTLPAPHVYDNLLAAIALARTAQVPWEAIRQALPNLQLPKRRLEIVRKGGVLFINDAYNACEVSMLSALDVLSHHAPARRVAVLGQMNELGPLSEGCHRKVGEKSLESADVLFCLGEGCAPIVEVWRSSGRSCKWASSLHELTESLKAQLKEGDVVLLKGSRSNELWKCVDISL
jgi:UDP-N-acetylmuramoyl-tripeptide--D-alanyl-D-alanine ligase